MKLFYKAGACSLSPHIVLREAGLDFTAEKVDLAQKKTESGADYLAINPKGQVPALLLDDGSLLTEGVAIVQYLADRVPDRNLIPAAGTLSRYHAIEWLNYIATELHKGFSPLFNPKTPEEYKTIARARLEQQFSYLDSVLAKQHFLLIESGRTAATSASWKAATGAFSARRCCCMTPWRWKKTRRSAIWPRAWRRSKPR